MTIGYACCDITPKPGCVLSIETRASGAHDPLQAKLVYFDPERGTPFLLASLDLTGLDALAARVLRGAIAAEAGLPVEAVRVSVTHSHTAPDVSYGVQEILNPLGLRHSDLRWYSSVVPTITEAARRAIERAEPAVLRHGTHRVEGVAANRTVIDEDGTTRTRFGYDTGRLADAPTGLHDPVVSVLLAETPDGSPIVTVFNYACHTTAFERSDGAISADFPAIAARIVEEEIGGAAMLLQGACGDVGTGKFSDGSERAIETLGARLAEGVLRACAGATAFDGQDDREVRLRIAEHRIPLREDLPSVDELNEALGDTDHPFTVWRAASMLNVIGRTDLDGEKQDRRIYRCESFVFGSPEWCIVGLPAESFVASQIGIRALSPAEGTLVGACFDCDLWYIPSREAYAVGAYETDQGWSYVARGASERIAESTLSLIPRGDRD